MRPVVVINGFGGVGKDEFIKQCSKFANIKNISSVDKVKEAAEILVGKTNNKNEKYRKLLSDLKVLSIKFNDAPYKYIAKKINTFKDLEFEYDILFIHVREPEEIDKLKKDFGVTTLLITAPNIKQITSNMADANVFNYKYDYVIENNGTLKDLENKACNFIKDVIGFVREKKVKPKIKLGIDLDDVLNNFLDTFVVDYNNKYNDNLKVEDIKSWDISQYLKPEAQKTWFKDIVLQKGFFRKQNLKPYAKDFLEWANKYFDCYIISSSYFKTVYDKAEWIVETLTFFDIRRFIPCYHKHMIDVDILIDDKVENLTEFDGNTKILMDMPHNQDFNNAEHNIIRFKDLRQVKEYLKDKFNIIE